MSASLTALFSAALLQTASHPSSLALPAAPQTVLAVRVSTPIVLDGDLGDPAWREAVPFGQFIQLEPDEDKPATERTEVRVLFSDEALYIGAHLYDSSPDSIVARLARRDAQVTARPLHRLPRPVP